MNLNMPLDNQRIPDFFQRKIVEVYNDTEIRKVPDEPLIIWEEKEVPYTETETYYSDVDDGIQWWVYVLAGIVSVIGVIAIIKGYGVTGIFFLLFAAGIFLPAGNISGML